MDRSWISASPRSRRLLRDSVRKLMQKHAPPEYVRRHDRERSYPEDLFQAWAEAGLLALPFPEDYGGLGGSVMDMVIVAEEIARVSADLAMAYSGNIFCGLNLVRKASDEQKRRLAAATVRRRDQVLDLDVGARRRFRHRRHAHHRGARRQRMGDQRPEDLGLDGAGADNNVINLYVKTDPKAHYRQGLSLFLVDKDTPGLSCASSTCSAGAHRHLRALLRQRPRAARPAGRRREQGLGLRDVGPAGRARAPRPPAMCGGAQAVVDLACTTPKTASSSAGRSAPIRRSPICSPTWQTEVEAARTLMWRAAWMVVVGPGRAARNLHGEAVYLGDLRESREPGHAGARRLTATRGVRHGAALSATPGPRPSRPARRRFSATSSRI